MSTLQEKVQLLLNKAEGTDNEHERDAYNAKAEELMLKYGIEQAELEADGKVNADDIVDIHLRFNTPYHAIIGNFVQQICNSLGGLSVLQARGSKQREKIIYIIGHKSDVQAAEMLVDSLYKQAITAVSRWVKSGRDDYYRYLNSQDQWKARRQFVISFAYGAAERILAERTDLEETVSAGAALVLVSREQRVNDFVQGKYAPKESHVRTQRGYTGAAEGRAAGRQANVGAARGALQ